MPTDTHAIIGRIYDTSVYPGRWRQALDDTAGLIGAKALALVIRGKPAGARDLTLLSSVYLDFSRTPAGWYYGAWLSRLQSHDWDHLRTQSPYNPVPDTDTGRSAEALDARRDYAYLRKKTGVSRRMGVRLNSDAVWFDAMSFGFDQSRARIDQSAFAPVQPLMPHFTKALEIGRVFMALKARYKSVLTALDNVQAGLAIALPDGQIVVSNAEADRILGQQDGLHLSRAGLLVASEPDVTKRIAHTIGRASATAKGQDDQAEALIPVQRSSGKAPLLVDIGPVRDGASELERDLQGAIITLIDPDRVPFLRIERFAKLHALSEAETDVCRWIIEGATVTEIAERRGTKPATAKNQISAVLTKANARSRIDLIRLILRVLPPVQ